MLNIDKDDIRRVASQLDAFYTALKCFIYYVEIKNKQDVEKDNVDCWNFIEFTLIYTMLINWNEVFGINKDNKHWKEITFEQPEYTNRLYHAGEYTYTSWTEYRSNINDLSNNFISFPDPYHHREQKYNLEGIKVSLEVTHDWLYELVADNEGILDTEESEKWPITNKNHIDELKQEIQTIL
ncbi:MAG: hypothetical protein ACR2PU_04105 [Gammaproteobacteria bacterium]